MKSMKSLLNNFLSIVILLAMAVLMYPTKGFAMDPENVQVDEGHRKTIAILTSGGDAPGMNAIIRSVARAALESGMRVLGVKHGYNGLLKKDVVELNLRSVSGIIQRGGTILYTARSEAFQTPEGVKLAADNCRELGIEGIVVAGGDGSFRGASELTRQGIPCVGIPATIDNDICCSDYTIGFDTAVNTAVQMVDKIRDTAEAHDRCSVIEVMGRGCGDIALYTGMAVGATAIVVPERQIDFQRDIINRLEETRRTGKNHFVIVVAEGVGKTQEIAKRIETEGGVESRVTVLGHVVRGGAPSVKDRVVASRMGVHAVDLLKKSKGDRVVVIKDGKVMDLDITQALSLEKKFDDSLYEAALRISI